VKEQFQYARELIQNEQYDDARHILQMIDHPSAQAWLVRVDELDPPQIQQEVQQAIPKKGLSGWIRSLMAQLKNLIMGNADNPSQEVVADSPPQAQQRAVSQPQEVVVEEPAQAQEEANDENDLRGSDMSGAYLRYAQLEGADLRGSNFTGAYLFGANLVGANLSDTIFTGANLIGANLAGAYLSGANFSEAHLIGANLLGTDFNGVYMVGAKLPDKTGWTDNTDMTRFTNPNHPDFWQPSD